jgi:hypothetical protein
LFESRVQYFQLENERTGDFSREEIKIRRIGEALNNWSLKIEAPGNLEGRSLFASKHLYERAHYWLSELGLFDQAKEAVERLNEFSSMSNPAVVDLDKNSRAAIYLLEVIDGFADRAITSRSISGVGPTSYTVKSALVSLQEMFQFQSKPTSNKAKGARLAAISMPSINFYGALQFLSEKHSRFLSDPEAPDPRQERLILGKKPGQFEHFILTTQNRPNEILINSSFGFGGHGDDPTLKLAAKFRPNKRFGV